MKSSIYVSAEQIQVIGYVGGSVKQYLTHPLPEGTMINGMITDAAFLTECLEGMRKEHPGLFADPSLIVDGSSILSRRLVTPKLGGKRRQQLVRDDFADATDNPNNLVCGSFKMGDEGGSEVILACAADSAQVDSYTEAFKAAGIRLRSIHVGAQAILSFVAPRQELRQKSFILNLLDGFTMVSLIFQNGNNVFMSRSRLYGDTKEALFQNALDNLSGLIQFNRSQKFEELTHCYYLGVNEADLRLMEAINPYGDLQMGIIDIQKATDNAIPYDAPFAYMDMLIGNDGIDLIAARKELNRHIRQQKHRKLWIPLLALYVVALAAPCLYFWGMARSAGKDIDRVNGFLNDPAILLRQAELEALTQELNIYSRIKQQLDAKLEWEGSLAEASSAMLDQIIFLHGQAVSVTRVDFSEKAGTVRVSAKCADPDTPHDYVEALYRSGLAAYIDYPGYTNEGEDKYGFSIVITLAGKGAE
ncbi:MAG: hypothetical protein LBH95_02280 [Oscillospiraceae bacterium]|jgi:hypothetical protein|nr:hypothetical protein [Oscillospiraceae bacterium]